MAPKFGGGEQCRRCGKRVHFAEERRHDNKSWHKKCFTCCTCKRSLESTTLTPHEKEMCCKGCYGKQFGPMGYGYGVGAGALA